MLRRQFLVLCSASAIVLPTVGLISISSRMVPKYGGRCSFCQKSHEELGGLVGVAGRDSRICDECVRLCLDILQETHRLDDMGPHERAAYRAQREHQWQSQLADEMAWSDDEVDAFLRRIAEEAARSRTTPPTLRDLACSFCDTPQSQASKLIAGPAVYTCSVCIGEAGTLLVWGGLRTA